MKGDFSRNGFQPDKRYTGVRMQQGRVQLDSDWNEQVDIQRYLDLAGLRDVVGLCGGPKGAGADGKALAGFDIDRFQPTLFVVEDFDELRSAMVRYARAIARST